MSVFTSPTSSVRLGLFQSQARGETAAETTLGRSPTGDGRGRASIFAESSSFRVGILVPACECGAIRRDTAPVGGAGRGRMAWRWHELGYRERQ